MIMSLLNCGRCKEGFELLMSNKWYEKNKDNKPLLFVVYLLLLVVAIFTAFSLTVLISRYINNNGCFRTDIFGNLALATITATTILLSYMQYLDQKATEQQKIRDEQITENTKRLYEQDIKELERESELFYEYYSSITKLTECDITINAEPKDYYRYEENQYTVLCATGSKLEILTDIFDPMVSKHCLECDAINEDFLEVIKIKDKLSDLRIEIIGAIRNELNDLRKFIDENKNNYSEKYIHALRNKNTTVDDKIYTIIITLVYYDFFATYKTYCILQKQYIESKKENNYKTNKKCKDCKYSKYTYVDIEDYLTKLQNERDSAKPPEIKLENIKQDQQTTSNTSQKTP